MIPTEIKYNLHYDDVQTHDIPLESRALTTRPPNPPTH